MYSFHNVGTHNLQDLSIVNITSATLCLQFTLVYGTTTYDVHMHLEGIDNEPIQLMKTLDGNVGIDCFKNIPFNNWTLIACDGNSTYCNNPAVILTDINIPLIRYTPSMTASMHLSSVLLGKAMFIDYHFTNAF